MVASKQVIKKMKQDGWYQVGQDGSHTQWKHPTKPGKTTVPHPKKDLTIKTLRAIEKSTGLKF